MGVLVEVQRGVLREIQGIKGPCGDTIGAQDQGVSVGQWKGIHFQGIQALLKAHDIEKCEATFVPLLPVLQGDYT